MRSPIARRGLGSPAAVHPVPSYSAEWAACICWRRSAAWAPLGGILAHQCWSAHTVLGGRRRRGSCRPGASSAMLSRSLSAEHDRWGMDVTSGGAPVLPWQLHAAPSNRRQTRPAGPHDLTGRRVVRRVPAPRAGDVHRAGQLVHCDDHRLLAAATPPVAGDDDDMQRRHDAAMRPALVRPAGDHLDRLDQAASVCRSGSGYCGRRAAPRVP